MGHRTHNETGLTPEQERWFEDPDPGQEDFEPPKKPRREAPRMAIDFDYGWAWVGLGFAFSTTRNACMDDVPLHKSGHHFVLQLELLCLRVTVLL